ncbi:hypothetical protein HHL16_01140 [Pseudoflavitalea sp. G-6-1-2]|uniref:hypothetical protein n=1 Tax=Pseudoflavitalea sp. G-6-1-2 TaxID=2728841 RepID=UPI00146BF7B8|nr:hypothetical protein [Pseudoflavitalea sp. G-6-1-2]NML19452.1 hypothetical protein [Pseudoflavitalea sp. G-6-1-2]
MIKLFASGSFLCLLLLVSFSGCRTTETRSYESKEGIRAIVYQLEEQFGNEGSYSAIHMRYDDSSGFILTATGVVQKATDSLVVRQLKKGDWTELAVTPLKTGGNSTVLFSLKTLQDLQMIPDLIKASIFKLAKEIRRPGLEVKEVLINAPGYDGGEDPVRINIYVEPKAGDEKFELAYNKEGQLKSLLNY